MKLNLKKSLLMLFAILPSTSALAGQGIVGPVNLEYVSVISNANNHKPGSLEVGVATNFSLPSGVSCDTKHVTTLRSVKNYNALLQVLLAAHINNRQVYLGITDNPDKNAFPHRCSLTLVNMQ